MKKIYGTVFGKELKRRAYIYEGRPEVIFDLHDQALAFAGGAQINFVPDSSEPNHKITFKQILDSGKFNFEITHCRDTNDKFIKIGNFNGEAVYVKELEFKHFGGTTVVALRSKNNDFSRARASSCHPKDQFCKKRGIQAALDKLDDESVKQILDIIAS